MTVTDQLSTVRTFLRPDYHQWFPVFTREELHERLATMPFELATLLHPRNIRLAVQIDSAWRYLRYLRLPPAAKQVLLSEMLQSRGFSSEIAEAVAGERHHFVGPHLRPMAYLDRSIRVADHTFLSAPGLVSMMLSMSQGLGPNPVVCEIGFGTAFHALCMARVQPGAFMVGVERSLAALRIATSNVERAGMSQRFGLLIDYETEWAIAGADFIYSTAALTQAQLARLTRYGKMGSIWLVPRQLTHAEFESEPPTSWLWRRFGSYDGYCSGSWNLFVALERFTLVSGGRRRTDGLIYDVRFVRYED